MSPIEEHLVTALTRDLDGAGVPDARVVVRSADPENWCYRIAASGREFEIGFNHREQLWVHEITPGHEGHFASNDAPPVSTSRAARQLALQLVSRALAMPSLSPRNPPIL